MSRGNMSHNYEYIPGYSNALQKINSSRILLKLRQQPIQTRISTNNERDRRPLDPPPIVQIELDNSTVQETQDFLQNPYLFMSVSLVHSTTYEEITSTTQNTLSGQTTSSMYKLKDINNQDGGFFVFGDLSVKLEGRFRLKFSIFEITGLFVSSLKSIYSNIFQVYSSKSFPGMLESTFLSRSFSDQGVRTRIRKEHRVQIAGSRKRKISTLQQDEEYQQPYPPVMYQRSPWLHSLEDTQQQQRRRSSIMSSSSESNRSLHPTQYVRPTHIIPFSPPHPSYDPRPNNNNHGYEKKFHHTMMMPSPPTMPSSHRRVSMEDKVPLRRLSADPQYLPPRLHLDTPSRRKSLQIRQPSSLSDEIIHLPPLRSIMSIESVDAAVAMIELSSRQ